MRKLLILLIALLSQFHSTTYSQTLTGIVQGRVVDSLSGMPIPNFTVFIPYTTFGTTTNAKGEFVLSSLPTGQCDVMFRHVAYQTVKIKCTIKESEPVTINLKAAENTYSLDEIVKNGKTADWEQSLILFQKHFLGNTSGVACKIKNPKDLYFYYTDDVLMAHARQPLIIVNRYLGYEITYFLDYYNLYIEHVPDSKEEREKAREGLNSLERLTAGWTEPVNTSTTRYYQSFSGSALYKDLAIGHPLRALNWVLDRGSGCTTTPVSN